MQIEPSQSRPDALARASVLARRSRELRQAQTEVQELTQRELTVLARTASAFFNSIALPEFTAFMLPQSARGLRRIRHRILHRTIQTSSTGTLIRAMLLGRDGVLRLFTARTADSRDLLAILEPGRTLPPGVVRDVQDWMPTMRVPGFRPFEMLEKLSGALDVVEEQLAEAEHRVQVQKTALVTGDLSTLFASAAASPLAADGTPPEEGAPVTSSSGSNGVRVNDDLTSRLAVVTTPSEADEAPEPESFDFFARVEHVAAALDATPTAATALPRIIAPAAVSTAEPDEFLEEPDEWDDPIADDHSLGARSGMTSAAAARALFPVLPPPR